MIVENVTMETPEKPLEKDVRIRDVVVPEGLGLAPMAGATNLAFRLLCRRFGAGLTVTEMVSAKGLIHGSDKTLRYLERDDAESPVGAQVFGTEPQVMAEAAKKIEDAGFHLVDVNMGCPVPKIYGDGAGCALMRNPAKAASIVESMVRAVRIPVTVKMRKGWSEFDANAPAFARTLEQAGASAVAVHGRTAEQKYSGRADWDAIREVKAAVSIPVFGNGDIDSPEKADALRAATACDGVIIGRGALSSPWIFRQIIELRRTGRAAQAPSRAEIGALLLELAEGLQRLYGEKTAVLMMRRYGSDFSKGLVGGSEFRPQLMKAGTFEELESCVRAFFGEAIRAAS